MINKIEVLTEDEATLILLSISYTLAILTDKESDANTMLDNIVASVTEEEFIVMSNSILKKLDFTSIKPINSLPC